MKDQDLTFVGLTDDGTKLVLVSETGEEFHLPLDEKLRSAVRGDHARPGQLETKMESALRPRDIQARIRAGESPETVAAAAQTTIDKIMGYATPVLAERAHIADRAQRASVRRKGGEGSSRLLGDAVAAHLRERNVDPESVAWDAWRREDGRWTLVADYGSGSSAKRAEFVFDAPGRYVVAEDDEARVLVGESPAPVAQRPGTTGRRLSAVSADDEQLPLGEDAIELVTEPEAARPAGQEQSADAEPTTDLTGIVSGGDADWIATQASDRPAPKREAEPATEAEAEPEPEAEPEQPARKSARKGRRASVPSWDEIMFGGGKQE
jgi:hypothetical protein